MRYFVAVRAVNWRRRTSYQAPVQAQLESQSSQLAALQRQIEEKAQAFNEHIHNTYIYVRYIISPFSLQLIPALLVEPFQSDPSTGF